MAAAAVAAARPDARETASAAALATPRQMGEPGTTSTQGPAAKDPNIARSAKALFRARRAIILTGAGLSVSAGLPDFRSPDGLYSLAKRAAPRRVGIAAAKGANLFDANMLAAPEAAAFFRCFAAGMRSAAVDARPTPTHRLLSHLASTGRILRVYTQNIDGLDEQAGLLPPTLVQLHGTLSDLVCTRCRSREPFDKERVAAMSESGDPPLCPTCEKTDLGRARDGLRARTPGCLEPDIIMYGVPHPLADKIGDDVSSALASNPDVLLVIGSSLHVHGARALARTASQAVRAAGGISILLNTTPPPKQLAPLFDIVLLHKADDIARAWLQAWCSAESIRLASASILSRSLGRDALADRVITPAIFSKDLAFARSIFSCGAPAALPQRPNQISSTPKPAFNSPPTTIPITTPSGPGRPRKTSSSSTETVKAVKKTLPSSSTLPKIRKVVKTKRKKLA